MTRAIYLDHNATTPPRPGVARAVAAAMDTPGNASSVHGAGRAARRTVEDAREKIAALLGAKSDRVIFTSGGTEANNLALKGSGRRRPIVSAVEHPSVLEAAPGARILAVNEDGVVDPQDLERLLAGGGKDAIVSVMAANNETGVVQPITEIAAVARPAGALVHCDAVQAAGRIVVDIGALDADLLTVSAHKLGGPLGVGALVLGPGIEIEAEIRGGGQEAFRRAGTENVAAIAGFGVAAVLAAEELAAEESWLTAAKGLRDGLESRIGAVSPETRIVGQAARRLANTSCFTMPGVSSETQVMTLDLDGIMVSAGAACSSGKVGPSHVLAAMAMPAEVTASAIRVSLGWNTTAEDIDAFFEAWEGLRARLGKAGALERVA